MRDPDGFAKERICVTGMGVCSAIGNDVQTFAGRLREGVSGIREHAGIVERPIWAGLVENVGAAGTKGGPAEIDRAALLAIDAAKQAWADAFRDGEKPAAARLALVLGTSHGGRSQLDHCVEEPELFENGCGARKILILSPHYQQTDAVAFQLGIHGPVATVSSACSSGGAALAYAFDLLSAGKADHVLAGGMDGFSKITFAGFAALGAVAEAPCGPFSQTIGISLGEGAAVVVLERLETALRRGARVHAELLGCGSSWDGYHITEPDPTGEGILRSARVAAERAGVDLSKIDYVNVHGTGTRANDSAETMSLRRIFASEEKTPPASSTKSFTGHTLGASAVMGLISATLAMQDGVIPPTVNFTGPRPGCDLDFVPNQSRRAEINTFSCQSAGFGGVNTVLIGGKLNGSSSRREVQNREKNLVITGIGIISPIGLDRQSFQESLREGRTGITPVERFGVQGSRARQAGLINNFDIRRLMPTLNMRRVDLAIQYAVAAASQAMTDSRLAQRRLNPEHIGLVVGTTRGAAASYQRFLDSVNGGNWRNASAIHFPNLVMSSIGGHVSKALGLRGIASTVVGGTGWGVQTLVHAAEFLRQSERQNAVIVVITDEIAPLYFRLFDQMGHLATADSDLGEVMAPYQHGAPGMVLGEGAAAFVLERLDDDPECDSAYAELKGYGWTADAAACEGASPQGEWFSAAMLSAIDQAKLSPREVDVVYACGRGINSADLRDTRALKRVFGKLSTPVGCVTGNTGLAESACGGFTIAAALYGMNSGEVYPIAGPNPGAGPIFNEIDFVHGSARKGAFENTLVVASTDNGNNAAILLGRAARRVG